MKKILVVDNRDSFVYNLVEMLRMLSVEHDVVEVDVLEFPLDVSSYSGVLLSPGAGVPGDYPLMMRLLDEYYAELPFLGVCLGCQAIAEYFGGRVVRLPRPLHGHASRLVITDGCDTIFSGVANNSAIGRYHSWVVERDSLGADMRCIATDEDSNLMVLRHVDYPIYGVQFHPESVISEGGYQMLSNWLRIVKGSFV